MTKVQTSIILVHYKYPKILYNCIDSVINCSQRASYEIIVVDNSVNETLKIEINRKLPRVNYIKSTKNLGYGGGNNLGARYARGKYLFFLNPPFFCSSLSRYYLTRLYEYFVMINFLYNNF